MNRIYYWSTNFTQIQSLIEELSNNEKLIIPQFLLRAQLIEFALKYLLIHTPYKPEAGIGKEDVETMTMGQVIAKLKECKDDHLNSVIEAAESFKELRNEVTHKMVNSEKTLTEIEALIKNKLPLAMEIERGITYFAEYVESVLQIHFEEIPER
jgi:hypothetical protein